MSPLLSVLQHYRNYHKKKIPEKAELNKKEYWSGPVSKRNGLIIGKIENRAPTSDRSALLAKLSHESSTAQGENTIVFLMCKGCICASIKEGVLWTRSSVFSPVTLWPLKVCVWPLKVVNTVTMVTLKTHLRAKGTRR